MLRSPTLHSSAFPTFRTANVKSLYSKREVVIMLSCCLYSMFDDLLFPFGQRTCNYILIDFCVIPIMGTLLLRFQSYAGPPDDAQLLDGKRSQAGRAGDSRLWKGKEQTQRMWVGADGRGWRLVGKFERSRQSHGPGPCLSERW